LNAIWIASGAHCSLLCHFAYNSERKNLADAAPSGSNDKETNISIFVALGMTIIK
jgi:hypothetical protein